MTRTSQRFTTSAAFRPDIQGLRAIAVLLVVAYHLWPDGVTGGFVGVDVFFVISGFLITAHLLHHPPEGWRDLLEFWGRRIRRILPAAFLVLAVTAVASRLVAPETRWAANAGEIIASGLYVQNWVLASNSTDYLAAGDAPTPVQHYWSLAIEEQFYLLWPILLLGAFWLVRRVSLAPTPVVRLAMLSVVCASLAVSVLATQAEPASAYFITPTRVWELALGGCIATLPALGSSPRVDRARDGIAWVGIAMVLVAGATFTAATPFPGVAALLPVNGAALVIIAAAAGRTSPTRLLRLRPIQHIGDTSYSIYLWHWPLIALWPFAVGAITPIGAVAIVGATVGLATITKVCVEDPFRFAPSLRPLVPTFRFAVVGMLVVSMLGSAQLVEAQMRLDAAVASSTEVASGPSDDWGDELQAEFDDELANGSAASPLPTSTATTTGSTLAPDAIAPAESTSASPAPRRISCRGAAAIVHGFSLCPQERDSRMVPDPLVARSDWSDAYRDGCWIYPPFTARTTCHYGQGKVRIALVGNSHAGQWLPTLEVLAKRNGWSITTFLASRCNATDAALELYGGNRRLPRLWAVGPGGDPWQGVRPRHHLGAPVCADVG